MKLLIVSLMFFASVTNSHAVEVDQCPKRVAVGLTDIRTVSAQWLFEQLGSLDNEVGDHEKMRSFLSELDRITFKLRLVDTNSKRKRCQYIVEKSSIAYQGDEEGMAVLATSKGRDWLRIYLPTPLGPIGGFITVVQYDESGLTLTGAASLGLDDSSHPGTFDPTLAKAKRVATR